MRCPLPVLSFAVLGVIACGDPPPVATIDMRPRVEAVAVEALGDHAPRTVHTTVRAARDVWMTPLRAGRVVAREVEIGDPVRSGQILLRLDGREAEASLAIAEAAVRDAEAAHEEAQARQARVEALGTGASEAQRDEVRTAVARTQAAVDRAQGERDRARVNRDHHQIRAPFDGEIAAIDPEVGETVGTSVPVVRVVDLTGRRLELGLLADERARATDAEIIVRAAGRAWPAHVTRIASAASATDGTWEATVVLDGTDGPAPGTPVDVTVAVPRTWPEGAVAVPRRAIDDGVVFVVEGTQVRRVDVTPGGTLHDRVAVVGIAAGDRVVTHRNEPLSDGDAVVVVEPPP